MKSEIPKYAIETFSLTKIFSDWWGRDKVCAVDDLNLQIRNNEVFGLLGPNGSGKTTAIKLMLGLLHATKGKSLLLGGNSTDTKISARIGFMPEESYLYRYLNARETLDFYGRLFGISSKVRKMRIDALLDMVGLKAVTNRPVGMFSKGMARRIGLAQALINDPDLLILDEPTTGLDPIGTRQIKDLILQLAQRGKTILLCSHLLADVEDVCDRIAILYGGRIQAQGKVNELLQQKQKRQFTTGPISDEAAEKIKTVVEAQRTDCVMTSPMQKLETFFIETVTKAQQQDQPTSGAVSTTQIGDFLASPTGEETHQGQLLDKLVSGTEQPNLAAESLETEKVTPVQTKKPQADRALLDKLTKSAKPVETKPVVRKNAENQSAEPESDKDKTAESDILDKLTGDNQ
ncbi:MAG: ABC transporter ATP-binding protein [Planctomycetota bacterium]